MLLSIGAVHSVEQQSGRIGESTPNFWNRFQARSNEGPGAMPPPEICALLPPPKKKNLANTTLAAIVLR